MKSTLTVQIETDTLLKVIGQLRARGGSQDVSEAITSPGQGWTLPERRKYRFRLEDVAY